MSEARFVENKLYSILDEYVSHFRTAMRDVEKDFVEREAKLQDGLQRIDEERRTLERQKQEFLTQQAHWRSHMSAAWESLQPCTPQEHSPHPPPFSHTTAPLSHCFSTQDPENPTPDVGVPYFPTHNSNSSTISHPHESEPEPLIPSHPISHLLPSPSHSLPPPSPSQQPTSQQQEWQPQQHSKQPLPPPSDSLPPPPPFHSQQQSSHYQKQQQQHSQQQSSQKQSSHSQQQSSQQQPSQSQQQTSQQQTSPSQQQTSPSQQQSSPSPQQPPRPPRHTFHALSHPRGFTAAPVQKFGTQADGTFWVTVWPGLRRRATGTRVLLQDVRTMGQLVAKACRATGVHPYPTGLYTVAGGRVGSLEEVTPGAHYLVIPRGSAYAPEAIPVALMRL